MADTFNANYGEDSTRIKKRRVGKACDCCRVKKTKCNGMKPCSRCIVHNQLCTYTERCSSYHKEHPEGYVELLEARLNLITRCLQKLYQSVDAGEDITQFKAEGKNEAGLNKLVALLKDKSQDQVDDIGVWEEGTELATKFDEKDSDYLDSACAEFAEHYRTSSYRAKSGKRMKKRKGRKPKKEGSIEVEKVKNVSDQSRSSNSSLPQSVPVETEFSIQQYESSSPLSSLFSSSDEEIEFKTESLFQPNNVQRPFEPSTELNQNDIENQFLEQNSNLNAHEQLLFYQNPHPECLPIRVWPYTETSEGNYNMNGFNYYPQLTTGQMNSF